MPAASAIANILQQGNWIHRGWRQAIIFTATATVTVTVGNVVWFNFLRQDLARKCSTRGLGVNVWGLADFESSDLHLSDISPLAERTGGKVK
jgi:hypothetical protein